MDYTVLLALIIFGSFLFILLFKIIKTPLKWGFKLLINSLFGFIALFVINFLGDPVGFHLGINWINAAIVGTLGLPGVVLLLLITYLL